MRLKSLSRIILAFVLAVALPSMSRTNALLQMDPLAEQKADTEDGPRARLQREMAKKANQARQADLKRDTDKLLKLATELKESVDKTNAGTLSLDILKKAEEIEKLARSVKDKMKGS